MSEIKKLLAKARQHSGGKVLKMAACLFAVLLFSAMVISARAWMANTSAGAIANAKTATAEAAPQPVAPQTGEITVALRPAGFEPFEVTHTAGAFNLKIDNQSGAGQVTLRLYRRGQNEAVREIALTNGATEWTVELDLAAGDYSLTEANNPAWLLYIKVR
jgi:hypothetical protein